jgi:diguanylate cyclase (GGDEF)-like protein
MTRARQSFARWAAAVRAWPIWKEPNWLVGLVILVVAADLAVLGASAAVVRFSAYDLVLFGLLLGGVAVTVELTRSAGEKGGLIKDIYGAWNLPAGLLLPPVYVLVISIVQYTLIQLRIRRGLIYRRAYSAATSGLSFVIAGVVLRAMPGLTFFGHKTPTLHDLFWVLAVMVAAVTGVIVIKIFMIAAVKGSDPAVSIREMFFTRENMYNDFAEQCIGVMVTFGAAANVFLAPIALPVVALLQRSLRHAQLLTASRTDAKTGLLNARTWESEAEAEVARAVRARMALAVAVLDIDWFKRVNDTYGHLFGDEVLKDIARCLPGVLREYDSAGRFGGEEFVLLLPHTRAVDAFRIADRVRDHISGLSLHTSDGQSVQVTVSVGVAALDAGSCRELTDLLAAADAALYRAKRDGRNQVQMISTTRGLSAAGGRTVGMNAFGGVPAAPSAWDTLPRGDDRPAGGTDEVAARR